MHCGNVFDACQRRTGFSPALAAERLELLWRGKVHRAIFGRSAPASVRHTAAARACRSLAMTRRPSRQPASGFVQPALFGQQQRLFQLACRRGLQRLKAAPF
jgi:hypothetical protein